jgi:hypothetical protein
MIKDKVIITLVTIALLGMALLVTIGVVGSMYVEPAPTSQCMCK